MNSYYRPGTEDAKLNKGMALTQEEPALADLFWIGVSVFCFQPGLGLTTSLTFYVLLRTSSGLALVFVLSFCFFQYTDDIKLLQFLSCR